MRRTWTSALFLLLLATLVACGGSPSTIGNPVTTNPTTTASAAPSSVPSPTPSSAPARPSTAPAPPTPTTATVPSAPSPTRSPGPSAPAPPVATRPPAASPVATAPSTTVPQPNGPIPAGWQVYRGPIEFPIVIAYPPDWTVDDSLYPEQLIIFLVGPLNEQGEEHRVDIEPAYNGDGANIDVQRDEYFYRKTEFCGQKGIEYTERRQVSGSAFALLGATCDQSDVLYFLQVASGVTGGDEWNISLRSTYTRKEAHQTIFDAMLASINIYAPLPR